MSHASFEEGQGLVEYALILVMVVFVVVVSLQIVGPAVENMYSTIIAALLGLG
jgi:pilus assembly protein Flp/PilA